MAASQKKSTKPARKRGNASRKPARAKASQKTTRKKASQKKRGATKTSQKGKSQKRARPVEEHVLPVRSENEFRKDYLLDEYVLIAFNRAKRPHVLKEDLHPSSSAEDPFAPGKEWMTPPEIGRVPSSGKWQARWFENKYPLVSPSVEKERVQTTFFTMRPALGFHEILVDTPRKNEHWESMKQDDLVRVLKIIAQEIERLHEEKGIKYVVVFYNRGARAGASLPHSHTQIVALPFIPQRIDEKIRASASYYRMRRKCAYCMILEEERKRKERFVWENERFAIITPYASRYNYEALILPRVHKTSFQEFTEKDYAQLAEALHFVLKRLKKLGVPYNVMFYYERQTKVYKERAAGMHFHIEITPRIQHPAGFEIATRIMVNDVPPEHAAEWYRSVKA